MKLSEWSDHVGSGRMLQVSKQEAMRIIKSLSTQIVADSSNVGRSEFYTEDGRYFSIAVKVEES